MKKLDVFALILLSSYTFSCSTINVPLPTHVKQSNNLYLDNSFSSEEAIKVETEEEIFKLDQPMIDLVEKKLNKHPRTRDRADALLDHIFNHEDISLKYDGNANVTARDAYHSQTANCMSLTVMAYALATAAKLNVNFQQIDVPEYWVRNGKYNQLTGHINLIVREEDSPGLRVVWGEDVFQIDFDPDAAKKSFRKRIIDKNTVLAMFYNNKGANALVSKQYKVAYQYFKAATISDGEFSPAWGNLGILYKLNGYEKQAEKVYRHAISLKNDNLTSLSNLALLLKKQNRYDEANKIENYIVKIRAKNPYYHAVLADEAFYIGNYEQALIHYNDAIKLDDNEHEFYFGLAKVYYKLERLKAAKRAMKMAMTLNRAKDVDRLYLAKLNLLREPKTKL
ncbi:tetratricopeptide repeat protein [Colwellia sp. RSH04]|uniref:tetratricopeptide repeat protein n=1 Tax=Colwellia sp. RSH04 TaxID=2305464 RepID=UPI000E57B595|nr:tetratricopeptide repeat protein [Colwellia sp. RSH04]RHW77125.1 tetratricopeptide repeat protein [Colwellia sp. RSH04]